jgi:hypothetical protein
MRSQACGGNTREEAVAAVEAGDGASFWVGVVETGNVAATSGTGVEKSGVERGCAVAGADTGKFAGILAGGGLGGGA